MISEFLMGNEAIAVGALAAGVNLVAGYPGTPSTEVLETVAKRKPDDVYVEWSINEKAAMEVAAGAAFAGARVMVTCKQVGLNVATDPLMSLEYLGVKGGMVILVADDPGPISSQTEQDTRTFAQFAKIPVFDPSSVREAYEMTLEAFSASERNFVLAEGPEQKRRVGIATHGISYTYVCDNLDEKDRPRILRVGNPFPFPERRAAEFLQDLDEVLCVEELDPVIECALISVCGRYGLSTKIRGKLTGDIQPSGENTVESVGRALAAFLGSADDKNVGPASAAEPPQLPVRPPVLCAGCPHRASFYAVKRAMGKRKTIFCGDIGCYTLGNAQPLDMVDTCLCMGAGITIAQGVYHVESDTACFAFIGDSTFFASGITGVINAFYNQANLTVVILDNSTTAMTGHQPHPGTGRTMMGEVVKKVNIEQVLRGIGLTTVETVNPLEHDKAVACVKRVVDEPGVKAIIFKSPCVVLERPQARSTVDPETCIGCRRCKNELGCPALALDGDGKALIDASQCSGCTLCEQLCPVGAISGGELL